MDGPTDKTKHINSWKHTARLLVISGKNKSGFIQVGKNITQGNTIQSPVEKDNREQWKNREGKYWQGKKLGNFDNRFPFFNGFRLCIIWISMETVKRKRISLKYISYTKFNILPISGYLSVLFPFQLSLHGNYFRLQVIYHRVLYQNQCPYQRPYARWRLGNQVYSTKWYLLLHSFFTTVVAVKGG